MSGAVEPEPARPRPLSGGLWTLFSWLRRDDHSSSDSLSSAGSDRTAASFAFLTPAHYGPTAPASLPPPPPPTDSYRKRVHDRNLRRQHDRNITLHRKYGLYGFGYDSYTLPSGRRGGSVGPGNASERDRRATSECPRAHVPGKRRAPPPPSAPANLSKRRARKRPAPLPPLEQIKENANEAINTVDIEPMNRLPDHAKQPAEHQDNAMGCKPEKYSKKDGQIKDTKDVKIRHEKSFLKQIFENKKRNSAIETSTVKLLPNISELDKQAAEIIEKYRLKELAQSDASDKELRKNESHTSSNQQPEAWICTRCLRKYNSSVIICNYCLPFNKATDSHKSSKILNNCTQTKGNVSNVLASTSARIEDKEKLKEILKEMKDSLPKKPKNDITLEKKYEYLNAIEPRKGYRNVVEAPTLRIGSSISTNNNVTEMSHAKNIDAEASTNNLALQDINIPNNKSLTTINSVIITQPVVLVHTQQSNVVVNENKIKKIDSNKSVPTNNDVTKKSKDSASENITQEEGIKPTLDLKLPNKDVSKTTFDLNTPLKISSLLNPFYVPKNVSTNTETKLVKHTEAKDAKKVVVTEPNTKPKPVALTTETQNVVNSAVPTNSHIKPTISCPPLKEDGQVSAQNNAKENNKPGLNEKSAPVEADDKKIIKSEIKTNNNLLNQPLKNVNEPLKNEEVQVNNHARRRNLINQLEKSIAKGDELAAAEAAAKLAQLRLSCSVLSFSSQIVAEASTSSRPTEQQIELQISDDAADGRDKVKKVEDVIQRSSQTSINPLKVTPTKEPKQKIESGKEQHGDVKSKLATAKEDIKILDIAKPVNLVLPNAASEKKFKTNSETKETIPQNLRNSSEPSTSKGVATQLENNNEDIPILIWVEDKETTRGPVQLHVRRNAVMGDLRAQAEQSLGLAAGMQRWIVGRTLCSDDITPLVTLAGPELSAPFYLCIVESDTKNVSKPQSKVNEDAGNVYNELVKLEKQALISNPDVFECGVCMEECPPSGGVVLRECVHSFCKECLSDVVRHSEEPVVSCPAMGCPGVLQEREIRALVSPDEYEKWLARGLAAAESGTRNAFHCRTRDCTGWALCDPGVLRFPCPVCKRTNCVPCQAIHEGETCQQHQVKLTKAAASSDASQTDEGTRALLNTLISRGEALECPECSAIITKKWGCDWVKCSACKTEICWVTKGRRWGIGGRGDTSGGCRCGVDGKRCHPSCGYCH